MSSSNFLEYGGCFFPPACYERENLEYARNEFQVREDDIISITYPKSGTIWMQEILSLIRSDGDPTVCRTVPVWDSIPWIDITSLRKKVEAQLSTRFMSSHLPVHLFPKSLFTSKAKVIYTVRDPRDILVSLHFYSRTARFLDELDKIEDLLPKFLRGEVLFGSWFDHVREWLGVRDQVNLLLLTYEELCQDLRGSVLRICNFLGKELNEEAVDSVVENATFEKMKDNSMCNYSIASNHFDIQKSPFIRKGICGDWKNHFTPAMSESFDAAYKEAMKDVNFKFTWDQC